MLAHVDQDMREAWRPLLFADEYLEAKVTRDPVAPAKRSARVQRKAATPTLEDQSQAHSFRTLMDELATSVRNTCRIPNSAQNAPTITTTPNPTQQRALQLLDTIQV